MDIDGRVLSRLAATTRFADIRVHDEVGSTNDLVADAARSGAPEGLVVVAGVQRAGRGRLGRRWDAPAGSALLASVLLRPDGLPAARYHLLTAAVALAAAAASEELTGLRPDLKWPNDLLVGPAKLAGVLAEVAVAPGPLGPGAVVVGIGLNLTASPPGATDLAAETGAAPVTGEALRVLLAGVEQRYGRWDAVADEHRSCCSTIGRRVSVEMTGRASRTGTATDVTADGRLRVAFDDGGAEALSAGDVTHLRPAEGAGW